MLKIVLLLSLAHTAGVLVDDRHYCALRYRRLCQGKGKHVACEFPASWDRELAQLAQRLADQCHFVHDDCRATVRYPYAGQSVGEVHWRRSKEPDVLSAQRSVRRVFDAWWGERRRVQPKQLTAPFRLASKAMVWGHFSQLAVWTLRAVGCGAVRHGFQYTRMLLVCDFSHTNMLGQRTITPGPIAPCPIHTARRPRTAYSLLCAPVRRPIPLENNDDRESIEVYDYDVIDELGDEVKEEPADNFKRTRTKPSSKPRDRTGAHKITKSDVKNWLVESVEKEKTLVEYKVQGSGGKTSPRAIDIFENELQVSNNEHFTLKNYHQWEMRRPNFEQSREEFYNIENEKLSNAQKKLGTLDDENLQAKGEEKEHPKTPYDTTNQGANLRRRWKQTRLRLQRPGANALINKPREKQLRRSSLTYFVLDQDDTDQLFRDTGFHVNWRKHSH